MLKGHPLCIPENRSTGGVFLENRGCFLRNMYYSLEICTIYVNA